MVSHKIACAYVTIVAAASVTVSHAWHDEKQKRRCVQVAETLCGTGERERERVGERDTRDSLNCVAGLEGRAVVEDELRVCVYSPMNTIEKKKKKKKRKTDRSTKHCVGTAVTSQRRARQTRTGCVRRDRRCGEKIRWVFVSKRLSGGYREIFKFLNTSLSIFVNNSSRAVTTCSVSHRIAPIFNGKSASQRILSNVGTW